MGAPGLSRATRASRRCCAPDWLEAARQAFLWRYFYDDCGRSDPGNCGPGLRGGGVELARRDARVNEAAMTSADEIIRGRRSPGP